VVPEVNGVDTVFMCCKYCIFEFHPHAPNSNQHEYFSSNRSKVLLSENRVVEMCFLNVQGERTAILRSLNLKKGVALAVTLFHLTCNFPVGELLPTQELGYHATTEP
jgi:hypothetical protein